MKKHNLVKVLLITIGVLVLLTWLLPVAYYEGMYAEQGKLQIGFFELLNYPVMTIVYFGYILMFALVIGGFYGILNKTGVYRGLLERLVKSFKGKESIVLSVIMVLFAVITSFTGLSIGLLFLFPFVISLVLLMGYNKIVAASVTVGSVMVGLMGTTYASSSIGILNQILSIDYNAEVLTKIIILVIGLVLLIFNTLYFGNKNKSLADIEKDDFVPAKDSQQKSIWPFVVIMDLVLLVMILSFIPWESVFDLDIFKNVTATVTEFEVFDFPIFGKILGAVSPFGEWAITDLITLVFIAGVLMAVCYRIKFSDAIDAFKNGAKRAFGPGMLMLLIYTCLIIATYHPFQLVITDFLLGLSKGFNVIITTVVAFLSSLFNVEMLYVGQSSVPYLITKVGNSSYYPLIEVIYQSIYGLVMLVAPTSVILMGTLAYLKISYKDWLKYIWKLFLELFVVLIIIFTIILIV